MTSTQDLQVLRSVADRTLRLRFGTWYWGDAIAIDGLLGAHQVVGGPYRDAVVACLERWTRLAPISFDDALVPGRAVLQLVAEGSLPHAAADRVIAALERLPLLDGAIPALEPHRPQFRFGVCIDALYHLPAMTLLAGDHRGDPDAERTAIGVATQILEVLKCPTGWAQWYDFSLGRNNAISREPRSRMGGSRTARPARARRPRRRREPRRGGGEPPRDSRERAVSKRPLAGCPG